MGKDKKWLTREIIINTLVDALKPLDHVQAFWEGGAAAFNRIDEWSDIDIYLVVGDDKIEETFLAVERSLKSLSTIEQKFRIMKSQWADVSQAFYRMKDASEYLVIDLAILKSSSPEKFLELEIHGKALFYFNKSANIKPLPLDIEMFTKRLKERKGRLKARFRMFNNFVQKEINRGNFLEAIELYHNFTLSTLIEALRMRHAPFHHEFKTRYIHYELPLAVIMKLKMLFFIEDERALQEKYRKASRWILEILS